MIPQGEAELPEDGGEFSQYRCWENNVRENSEKRGVKETEMEGKIRAQEHAKEVAVKVEIPVLKV